MHTLILRFIGIITLACGLSGNDCKKEFLAFIPDGSVKQHPCKKHKKVEVPIHTAYIRIRVEPTSTPTWPGSISCKDGSDCKLFPIPKNDQIMITGITDGAGLTGEFKENQFVEWKRYEAQLVLKNPPKNLWASMLVNSGTPSNDVFSNGMYYTRVTSVTSNTETVITMKNAGYKLTIPSDATVDIMNLPPGDSLGDPRQTMTSHKEHFFLHYVLADDLPDDCIGANIRQINSFVAQGVFASKPPDLNGSVSCSNSNYP